MSGPLQIVHDRPVPEDDPRRAYHSLPPGLLLRPSQVPGGDLGVWANHAWPPGVRFGPYQGELVVVNSRGVSYHSWEIFKDKATYSVDAHDITKANWMRFVNYACSDSEQNLAAYQYNGAIFYRTTKFIQPSQELLVWYGQDCDSLISLSAANEVHSCAANEVGSHDKNSSHCDVVVLDDDVDCCNISTEFDCRICDDVVRWDSSVHSSNNIDTRIENRHIRTVPDDIETYLLGFNNSFDVVCGTNSSNVISSINNNNTITTNNNNNDNTNNNGINTPNILLNSFENGIGIVTNIIETELDVITVDDDCPTNQLSDAFELNADDIIYPCPFCTRAFERKISLNHHMKVHKRSSLFKCGLCEKTFKYENSLMHHHRLHTGVGQYKCSICFKTFIRDFHLQRHLESHQDKRGNTCILCSVSFPSAKLFARHIKNYHSIDRELNCQTCGKTFSVAKDLIQHKRKHHQPNYKCTICQKTYASSNALTGHMRAHSEERPYACHICNKTFKGNSSLAYHIRTHTGERPYKCVTCGAAFISNQLRRLHMSKCYARHKNTR